MWVHVKWVTPTRTISDDPWLLVNAAPDYAGCKQLQAEVIKSSTSGKSQNAKIETSESGANALLTMTSRTDDGNVVVQQFLYRCLPDTVNPGGVKGK